MFRNTHFNKDSYFNAIFDLRHEMHKLYLDDRKKPKNAELLLGLYWMATNDINEPAAERELHSLFDFDSNLIYFHDKSRLEELFIPFDKSDCEWLTDDIKQEIIDKYISKNIPVEVPAPVEVQTQDMIITDVNQLIEVILGECETGFDKINEDKIVYLSELARTFLMHNPHYCRINELCKEIRQYSKIGIEVSYEQEKILLLASEVEFYNKSVCKYTPPDPISVDIVRLIMEMNKNEVKDINQRGEFFKCLHYSNVTTFVENELVLI